MYEYKVNIWDRRDGKNNPISLANWRVMNVLLCEAAARKLRQDGPPRGGIGQKHWQEHSDGTIKTSELPETERIGHTVVRFSTIEAQNWFQPIIDSVLGTAQDGSQIQLATEVEEKDGRARYVLSVPVADFNAFGQTKEERELLLSDAVMAALEGQREEAELSKIYSSFLHQEKGKEDMWKVGFKFPTLLETKMDKILRGENFGILPTAVTNVRVLKKQNSTTEEERISQAMKKADIGGKGAQNAASSATGNPPQPERQASTDSTKRKNRSSSGGQNEGSRKKLADGPTPTKE